MQFQEERGRRKGKLFKTEKYFDATKKKSQHTTYLRSQVHFGEKIARGEKGKEKSHYSKKLPWFIE